MSNGKVTLWHRICSPLPDFEYEETKVAKNGHMYRTTQDENGRWGVYESVEFVTLLEPKVKEETHEQTAG